MITSANLKVIINCVFIFCLIIPLGLVAFGSSYSGWMLDRELQNNVIIINTKARQRLRPLTIQVRLVRVGTDNTISQSVQSLNYDNYDSVIQTLRDADPHTR